MLGQCALVAAVAASASSGASQATMQPQRVSMASVSESGAAVTAKLPPVYYVNLATNADRKQHMEKVLGGLPTSQVTRVEAVNKADIHSQLASGSLKLEDGLSLLATNSTIPGPHIMGAYKASEYACTASHLRAIKKAWEDGHQMALIVEDDVSFAHVSKWDATIQELVIGAPTDWEIIQLHTNNPTFYLEQGLQLASQRMRQDASYDSCGGGVGDDLYVRYRIGHWSTAAYVINRFGMKALLDATKYGKVMSEPAAADELLFMAANTYTLQRPIFVTGDFGSDVAVAAADDDDGTDGPTNALINEFYSVRESRRMQKSAGDRYAARRACTPRRTQRLSVAVISTTTTNNADVRRALRNARALGPMERVQWTYAINSIDNQEQAWTAYRPAFGRAGVHLMAMNSGREMPKFMPKLLGQMRMFKKLETMMPTDYVWMMDGDISFSITNLPAIVNALITFPTPVVSQPTVLLQPTGNVEPNQAKGARPSTGQWFDPLNARTNSSWCTKELWSTYTTARNVEALQVTAKDNAPQPKLATNVYVARKLPLPAIESQTSIVASDFLRWYAPTLSRIAELQNQYGTDWGSDSMWCMGATRYINQGSPNLGRLGALARPDPTHADDMGSGTNATRAATQRDACALFSDISVAHQDTRTISQDTSFVKAGKALTAKLEREEDDYLTDDALNTWWTRHADCNALVHNRNAVADYKQFIGNDEYFRSIHKGARFLDDNNDKGS